jgi:RimJ/RimL family protein N-acetyltransferase
VAVVGTMAPPSGTDRLTFSEMTYDDLDDMARLLGDPEMMRYYPRPKRRDEALRWIDWNRRLYREHGHGLWTIRTRDTGEFVGDCGLTPQTVDGAVHTEVGWRVRVELQGRGYASEAGAACREHAFGALGKHRIISVIDPRNVASQRVAERAGLHHHHNTVYGARRQPVRIYAAVP